MFVIDTDAATGRLMRFLAVEGVTGREARIGKELVAAPMVEIRICVP